MRNDVGVTKIDIVAGRPADPFTLMATLDIGLGDLVNIFFEKSVPRETKAEYRVVSHLKGWLQSAEGNVELNDEDLEPYAQVLMRAHPEFKRNMLNYTSIPKDSVLVVAKKPDEKGSDMLVVVSFNHNDYEYLISRFVKSIHGRNAKSPVRFYTVRKRYSSGLIHFPDIQNVQRYALAAIDRIPRFRHKDILHMWESQLTAA